MNKPDALQNLLNGTASKQDIALLNRLLASGEISIGGNVNNSTIVQGDGNNVQVFQLTPELLDLLDGRKYLSNLDRDLTGEEVASGLLRLEELLPENAPVLLPQFKTAAARLRPMLKAEVKALSESARRERLEALAAVNSICIEAVDVSFNGLAFGEAAPDYNARSPFRGLESFRPEDREFFFGRKALTEKLLGKIKAHPFLAVLGASGSGKSSLVMAGVIPALDSDYVIFRPGTNPLDELESTRGKSLIVVDQFEELFTLTRDESVREDFIARLLDESSHAKIILTLRSDFLGEVGSYRTLSAEIQNHLEIVPPMDVDELRRAMEGQAGVTGLRFEADLSQQILDDVAGEPGAMPLLQHALWELWNRRHGRNLRASEYRAFGGVKQAITSTAEKVYADCSKPEQDQLRDIFLRLTRLDPEGGNEGRDTRRRVSLGDLIPSGRDATSITLLLDKLANARLIVKTVNEDKTEVEVAHEALIHHWERLRIWLNEDRDALRLRESVSEDARRWEHASRDESMLNHRGGRLDDALVLGKDSKYRLTEIEQVYLNACIKLRERELRNKESLQRKILISLIGFSILILGLFVFSRIQLNTSRAQLLGFQSQIAFEEQRYNTAWVFAYEANKIHNNEIANSVLAQLPYSNFPFEKSLFTYDTINSIAWSSNSILASGSSDNLVLLWDIKTTDQPIQTLKAHTDIVTSVAWSPDDQLASGSADGTVIIWNLKTGRPSKVLVNPGEVESVAWSADGQLASGLRDGTIILWDLKAGLPAQYLKEHKDAVESLAWSANGKLASGSSRDNSVIIWDFHSGKSAYIFKNYHVFGVSSLAWSINEHLASVSNGSAVTVWDMKNDQSILTLDASVESVAWSSDGRLATGSYGGRLTLWDIKTGESIEVLTGHTTPIRSIAWSPDGKLASSGSWDNTIVVWDLTSSQHFQVLDNANRVDGLAWSKDGRLASGSDNNTIIIWNLNTNRPAQILNGGGNFAWVSSLDWSTDGKLASASTWNKSVVVWDLDKGEPAQILETTSEAYSVAWSTDGKLAAGLADGKIIVWDFEAGQIPQTLYGLSNSVNSVAWSIDGRLASGSSDDRFGGMVIVWNIETGLPNQALKTSSEVESVAWSVDGKLASGSKDGMVIVWDLNTGQPLLSLKGGGYGSSNVAWSPDGKLASSSTGNPLITIWNLETGQPIQTLKGDKQGNSFLAWSTDGSLAHGALDGTVKIIHADMLTDPCNKISRNMAVDEWIEYQGLSYIYQPACPNLYDPTSTFNFNYSNELQPLITWKGRLTILVIVLVILITIFGVIRVIYRWAVGLFRIIYKMIVWLWQRIVSLRGNV